MNHDWLTRVYLRHYAFLIRRYPRQAPMAIFHLATIGISALVTLALLASTAIGLLLVSYMVEKPIVPWDLPEWALAAISIGMAFLPGIAVDRKLRQYAVVDRNVIDFYSSRAQRSRWWLAILSILPLGLIVAACFTLLRVSK